MNEKRFQDTLLKVLKIGIENDDELDIYDLRMVNTSTVKTTKSGFFNRHINRTSSDSFAVMGISTLLKEPVEVITTEEYNKLLENKPALTPATVANLLFPVKQHIEQEWYKPDIDPWLNKVPDWVIDFCWHLLATILAIIVATIGVAIAVAIGALFTHQHIIFGIIATILAFTIVWTALDAWIDSRI